MSDAPLTYQDLQARWGRPGKPMSKRQVNRICKSLNLHPMDLGHRTKRFRPADVLRAEGRSVKP